MSKFILLDAHFINLLRAKLHIMFAYIAIWLHITRIDYLYIRWQYNYMCWSKNGRVPIKVCLMITSVHT